MPELVDATMTTQTHNRCHLPSRRAVYLGSLPLALRRNGTVRGAIECSDYKAQSGIFLADRAHNPTRFTWGAVLVVPELLAYAYRVRPRMFAKRRPRSRDR